MILVDYAGHLVSTESEDELREFAEKRLNMKRSWYQGSSVTLRHPHYDLTTQNMQRKAREMGAEYVTPQDLIRRAWWSKSKTKA